MKKIEEWQILSPVKRKEFGVEAINNRIHKTFRQKTVDFSSKFYFNKNNLPKPLGVQLITYGDKVINVVNHKRYGNLKNRLV